MLLSDIILLLAFMARKQKQKLWGRLASHLSLDQDTFELFDWIGHFRVGESVRTSLEL